VPPQRIVSAGAARFLPATFVVAAQSSAVAGDLTLPLLGRID
jgi:hypothetical protein